MLFSVEQAFVGREEIRAPLKTPAWEASRSCEAREKNRLSVFHIMSLFRPGSSKMSSNCQKSVHNSALFVNLMHSVIDFEGE